METAHLSKQAYERLQHELEERSGPNRRSISAAIERAREHGDLSENGEYHAAKNEQGLN
ncbi:MAG: transcription elongation factor GreA, partial [Acidimicrobiia bacterium]